MLKKYHDPRIFSPDTSRNAAEQPASAQKAAELLMQGKSFAPLTLDEAQTVVRYLHPCCVPAGEPFIVEEQSQCSDFMMLVLSGNVMVESALNKRQSLPLSLVGTGKWVGELCFIDGKARQASCRVTDHSDLHCAILTRADYLRLLDEAPRIAAKLTLLFASNITASLRDADQKLCLYAGIASAMQQNQPL